MASDNFIVMGIDPGVKGAAVLLDSAGSVISAMLLEDLDCQTFIALFTEHAIDHVYLEKAQSFPGQHASWMFSYAVGFGKLLGWLEAAQATYTLVAPVTWTKALHKGCTAKEAKGKSLEAAKRLFPKVKLITGKGHVPHMGIVDALLIAEYGRRNFK